jgi:hypothetical protein
MDRVKLLSLIDDDDEEEEEEDEKRSKGTIDKTNGVIVDSIVDIYQFGRLDEILIP